MFKELNAHNEMWNEKHDLVGSPDNHWMYGMLLGYEPDVRVLEPAFVAEKIQRQGEQIADI